MDKAGAGRTVSCVFLAAGAGSRFGGGKLLADFRGEALYERALRLMDAVGFDRSAVVSGCGEILAAAARRGFLCVRNDEPERGISLSVRLGLEAVKPCGAVLFLVGDQPLLTAESVRRILAAGAEHPEKIIVPRSSDGRGGSPCLFPEAFFPELAALEGDRGGRRVIRAHPEAVFAVELPGSELIDTDTREALQRLSKV